MNDDRLIQCMELLIGGDISAEDHAWLQQTLKEDASARERFRERMDLEAGLRTLISETRAIPVASPSKLNVSSEPSNRSGRRMFVAVAVAASVLIALGLLVWDGWNTSDTELTADADQLRPDSPAVTLIGDLRQQSDCEWITNPAGEQGRFASGLLSLQKGAAELKFDSGTQITLEGPCELEVASDDSVSLFAGKVFVSVTDRSSGFALRTPESTIVDEGSDYAVSIEEDATEVHVFDGRVAWIPETSGDLQNEALRERIDAGEAKRYLRSDPTRSKLIPFGKRQFVKRIQQEIAETAGDSLLSYDGFENLAGRLRRGRSGFGWDEGWQPAGQSRGRVADLIDTPAEELFGSDRSGRRQLSLRPGDDIRRRLSKPLAITSNEAIFVSLLIERRELADAESRNGSLQVSLEPDLPGRGRRRHQTVTFGVTNDGYPMVGRANAVAKDTTRLSDSEPHFLVLKLAIDGRSVTPFLRVYTRGDILDPIQPSLWSVIGEIGSVQYPPESVRISNGTQAVWLIDELRVGTTWESVTSNP